MEQWLLHDELFYKYKYEVPVPRFNSNANRAAFRRIPESDLRLADRVGNDVWLTWHRPESRPPKGMARSSGLRLWSDVAPAARGVHETSMVMSCSTCGYLFPDTSVYIGRGHQWNREGAFVWTCMYCLDDGGLCREACVLSYRTKWRQIPDDHASWAARYPARSLWKPGMSLPTKEP